jgi:hypothetical protein
MTVEIVRKPKIRVKVNGVKQSIPVFGSTELIVVAILHRNNKFWK